MSIVAIAPMPYGYYAILRLVVFAACVLAVGLLWSRQRAAQSVVPILVGLLFNPVIRVPFTREVWVPLNVLAAVVLVVYGVVVGSPNRSNAPENRN
jgi:hypothetical protein